MYYKVKSDASLASTVAELKRAERELQHVKQTFEVATITGNQLAEENSRLRALVDEVYSRQAKQEQTIYDLRTGNLQLNSRLGSVEATMADVRQSVDRAEKGNAQTSENLDDLRSKTNAGFNAVWWRLLGR